MKLGWGVEGESAMILVRTNRVLSGKKHSYSPIRLLILYQVNGDGLSRLDRRLDGGDGIPHERAVQLLVGGVDGSLRQAGGSILEQKFKS